MDSVDSLITPMELTDDIMNTQFYDKVDDYKALEHTQNKCRFETYEETHNDHYTLFFDVETIANGVKHEPYLCWVYNNDIQQDLIGINTCAQDMLNALPTDKNEIVLIAHNSDYDCIFILEYLQNVKPIIENNRFLHINTTYLNPIHKHNIKLIVGYS